MPGNPQIPQGNLNRLLGSVIFPSFPALIVTAPFLGQEGISLSRDGDAVDFLPTMTSNVTSPAPLQMVTIGIDLIRSQPLAQLFEAQLQTDAQLGNCTIRTDSGLLGPYKIQQCAIQTVGELRFNGRSAGYGVMLRGSYPINANLWT